MPVRDESGYQFLLTQHLTDVERRMPTKAPAIRARVENDIVDRLAHLEDRRRQITAGGGKVGAFQHESLTTAHRELKVHLATLRKATVETIGAEEAKLRAAARPSAAAPEDATAKELRLARLERHAERLRTLDPLELEARLTPTARHVMTDLEAIEFAAATGFPIVLPAHRQTIETKVSSVQQALEAHGNPEIAALAEVRSAYAYSLAIAAHTARELATADGVDVWATDLSALTTPQGAPFPTGAPE